MERNKKLPQELLHDIKYRYVFMAVRVDETQSGEKIGRIIASGNDYEEVLTSLHKDRKENPNKIYFFAKPMKADEDIRQHWTYGGKQ